MVMTTVLKHRKQEVSTPVWKKVRKRRNQPPILQKQENEETESTNGFPILENIGNCKLECKFPGFQFFFLPAPCDLHRPGPRTHPKPVSITSNPLYLSARTIAEVVRRVSSHTEGYAFKPEKERFLYDGEPWGTNLLLSSTEIIFFSLFNPSFTKKKENIVFSTKTKNGDDEDISVKRRPN